LRAGVKFVEGAVDFAASDWHQSGGWHRVQEIAPYFDNQPAAGSPDGDRFDALATLVGAYEDRHHAIPDADPIEVLHCDRQHGPARKLNLVSYSAFARAPLKS
jgi:hypothetical protein